MCIVYSLLWARLSRQMHVFFASEPWTALLCVSAEPVCPMFAAKSAILSSFFLLILDLMCYCMWEHATLERKILAMSTPFSFWQSISCSQS